MDEEELRWTVRMFADCLSPDERATHLKAYSEHYDVERLRQFLPTFIQQYTDIALKDLTAREGGQGTRLADLTEEELQSMSLAEKCYLLAADPEGLRPFYRGIVEGFTTED